MSSEYNAETPIAPKRVIYLVRSMKMHYSYALQGDNPSCANKNAPPHQSRQLKPLLLVRKGGVCTQFSVNFQTSDDAYLALQLFRLDIGVLESSQDSGGSSVEVLSFPEVLECSKEIKNILNYMGSRTKTHLPSVRMALSLSLSIYIYMCVCECE